MDKTDSKTAKKKKWYGFDLDGTVAEHLGWHGYGHIGKPIRPIVYLMKQLHENGEDVRLFTARIGEAKTDEEKERIIKPIEDWCYEHLGFMPRITNEKDSDMLAIFDDRSKQVVKNKGILLEDLILIAKPELEEAKKLVTQGTLEADDDVSQRYLKRAVVLLDIVLKSFQDVQP